MDEKYIIIQKKKIKVPLLAGDGDWETVVGRNVYCCDIFLEALFASLIYDPDYYPMKEVRHYITERIDKNTTPVYVDNFIKAFKAAHKPIPLDEVSLSDAQPLGNDSDGCCIPIYKYIECITVDEEKKLLKEIAESKKIQFSSVSSFFFSHLRAYDTCFYPKWGRDYEAEYVAINFLRIHGFHVNDIQKQQDCIRNGQVHNLTAAENDSIIITSCIIVEIIIIAVASFFGLFEGITKWVVYIIMAPPYLTMLGAVSRLVKKKKKKKTKSKLREKKEYAVSAMSVSLFGCCCAVWLGTVDMKACCTILLPCGIAFICTLTWLVHLCLLSNDKYKVFHGTKRFKLLKMIVILAIILLFSWIVTLIYPMFFPPIEYYIGK